ncbi:MAG: hypothetical protein OEZ04_06890 [Nitrospinota bacterium]|nr:hypothetical protein [Nitrospinota bacterium]
MVSGEGVLESAPGNSKYHVQYTARIKSASRIRINQIYFPGWKVTVDGEDIDADTLRKDSEKKVVINFQLEPGAHEISALYEGPPYWRERNVIIFLVVMAHIGVSMYVRRRYFNGPLRT